MRVVKMARNTSRVAAKALRQGKVIVCPTDTVYGLVCDATNEKAVKRLFKIKRRPKGRPIPVFVRDIKMAKRLAYIDKRQEAFLRKHWPGRVTAVLRAKSVLPRPLSGGVKTVGLRIPDYPFAKELLNRVSRSLTGTSANISGKPACRSAEAVIGQLKNRKHKPDFIIDAGRLPKRKPSKIVDLIVYPWRILRK